MTTAESDFISRIQDVYRETHNTALDGPTASLARYFAIRAVHDLERERIAAALLAAWPTDLNGHEALLIRVALRVVATELSVDLDAVLAGPAEVTAS